MIIKGFAPKVMLDMDGVLADFDGWLAREGIRNENSFIHTPREEWTPQQIELDRKVVEIMKVPGFFRNLSPMPGFTDLWKAAGEKPYVLTARPKDPESAERVTREKREWITEKFGDIGDRFICCLRSEKRQYARSHYGFYPRVLVDDMAQNCIDWHNAGGIAVHYKDVDQAIEELKKVV